MTEEQNRLRELAVAALVDYAGTPADQAEQIIDALLNAAVDEALDVVAGATSLPTAVADLRAARLRRIYEHFDSRALTRLEIQTIFRVPAATAESVDRRMRGTFPQTTNVLLAKTIADSAEKPTRTGSPKAGYQYEIEFRQRGGIDAAETLLERRGLSAGIDFDRRQRRITIPIRDEDRARRILNGVLGLEIPR